MHDGCRITPGIEQGLTGRWHTCLSNATTFAVPSTPVDTVPKTSPMFIFFSVLTNPHSPQGLLCLLDLPSHSVY